MLIRKRPNKITMIEAPAFTAGEFYIREGNQNEKKMDKNRRPLLAAGYFLVCSSVLSGKAAEAAGSIDKKDGEYTIEITMKGGSGRASIASPAVLTVKDGRAYARIQWSSSHYDYMIVGGEKFLPIEGEEYSTFEIPVLAFDEPVDSDSQIRLR